MSFAEPTSARPLETLISGCLYSDNGPKRPADEPRQNCPYAPTAVHLSQCVLSYLATVMNVTNCAKLAKACVSIWLAGYGFAATNPAMAAPLLFTPNGDANAGLVQGQASLDRVGTVLLHHGSAE